MVSRAWREGPEGFELAAWGTRGAKRCCLSPRPWDEQPWLEGALGTRGDFSLLKPAEHEDGLAGARGTQAATDEAVVAARGRSALL